MHRRQTGFSRSHLTRLCLHGQHDPSTVRRRFGGLLPDDPGCDIGVHGAVGMVATKQWGNETLFSAKKANYGVSFLECSMEMGEVGHGVDAWRSNGKGREASPPLIGFAVPHAKTPWGPLIPPRRTALHAHRRRVLLRVCFCHIAFHLLLVLTSRRLPRTALAFNR